MFFLVFIDEVITEVPELCTLGSDGVHCIVVALDELVPNCCEQLGLFQGLLQSEHPQPSIRSRIMVRLVFAWHCVLQTWREATEGLVRF